MAATARRRDVDDAIVSGSLHATLGAIERMRTVPARDDGDTRAARRNWRC
jgi:hypothetical protein